MYGHGSHLGHMTSIILINFHLLVPQKLRTNLVENGQVVPENSKFQLNNLGPRSKNDLDLHYLLSFTELAVCIYKMSSHWLH